MKISFPAQYATPPEGPTFTFSTDIDRIACIRSWHPEAPALVMIEGGPLLNIFDKDVAGRVVEAYLNK